MLITSAQAQGARYPDPVPAEEEPSLLKPRHNYIPAPTFLVERGLCIPEFPGQRTASPLPSQGPAPTQAVPWQPEALQCGVALHSSNHLRQKLGWALLEQAAEGEGNLCREKVE